MKKAALRGGFFVCMRQEIALKTDSKKRTPSTGVFASQYDSLEFD